MRASEGFIVETIHAFLPGEFNEKRPDIDGDGLTRRPTRHRRERPRNPACNGSRSAEKLYRVRGGGNHAAHERILRSISQRLLRLAVWNLA